MKTNQIMEVAFKNGSISIGHKTMMVNLGELFKVGNIYRLQNGKSLANVSSFKGSSKTAEFVEALSRKTGISTDKLLFTRKKEKASKGQNEQIMCHLYIAIFAAEYLSPDFHVEVIDTFVNSRLLDKRDDSGDAFKSLMSAIKKAGEPILGDASEHHFKTIASIIKSRFDGVVDWNMATAEQLARREKIQSDLTTALRMGFIKDWEHLKQVASEI